MSEEKKTVELKEEELEETSGGYAEETVYSFEEGDCFSDDDLIYKVLHNRRKMSKAEFVECTSFYKHLWIECQVREIERENYWIPVSMLIECNYEGVNFI